MKTKMHGIKHWQVGLIFGVVSFVALTGLADGLIEFSQDVGMLRWLGETVLYAFSNKLVEKLIASVVIGSVAAFASSMIAYGKQIKARKHQTTRLSFDQKDSGTTRIA